VGLRYSPDGKRLIAGGYPGGIIQLWDVETGKQLTKIETGYGYRGSADYFFVSPDWRTIYASRHKRKATRVEQDEKKLTRWEMDGDVRAWDLATGELRDTYKHDPPRGISAMVPSPDGSRFATFESLSGVSEREPARAASLWDVKTKQLRPLPEQLDWWSVYTPDGKTLAAPAETERGRATAIHLFDVASVKPTVSIPVTEKGANLGFIAFARDGKLLVGQVRSPEHQWLKLWDPATGQEVGSVEGEKKDPFIWMAFSPDGRTLAATNAAREGPGKLFLVDLRDKTLRKTIVLGEKLSVLQPAFSSDGKWIAVPTQMRPDDPQILPEAMAEDLPQPRIHLIEAASGEVRETLVAPQGFTVSVCFSPDGKTLATGGAGKALLWDMSKPPGAAAPDR
jgi:WD40 repeat protein